MPKRIIKRRKKKKRIIKRRPTDVRLSRTFTPATKKILYEALRARLPMVRACELAGISTTSFYSWMKKGLDEDNRPYYKFRKKIMRIQAENEMEALDVIRAAAAGGRSIVETKVVVGQAKGHEITRVKKVSTPSWQAAAWFLERRHREEYGRNTPDDPFSKRSPEDIAQDIKRAVDVLFNTVPTGPESVDHNTLPKDMP